MTGAIPGLHACMRLNTLAAGHRQDIPMPMLCRLLLSAVFVLLPAVVVQAQDAEPPTAGQASGGDAQELDTIVVSGRVTGPGLWKVSRGEHVLWVLGTVSPVPRDIEWDTGGLEAAIAGSSEWIQPPGASFSARGGMLRNLTLLPSALRARRNPDGKSLQEVIPAADYMRWQRLKAQYLPRRNDVEQWRPSFAGQALYSEAIDRVRLGGGTVGRTVSQLARRHGLATTSTLVEVKVGDPRGVLREFRQTDMGDIACLRAQMDWVEHGLPAMARRANAWAQGDVQALMQTSGNVRGNQVCQDLVMDSALGQRIGVPQAVARSRQQWLAAVEAAIARNASSFATLPMAEVIGSDGLLAQLQARGYVVQAP